MTNLIITIAPRALMTRTTVITLADMNPKTLRLFILLHIITIFTRRTLRRYHVITMTIMHFIVTNVLLFIL